MKRWIIPLVLVGVAAPAAVPLLSGSYYFSDDGFLHLFRVFALDQELRQGIVYPRWLPEFGFGYGFPVFNFYAPLFYYFAETFHLFGLSIPDAIKAVCAAIIAIGAVGAYLMGVEFFRASSSPRLCGILTAAAFIYFPYFIIDIYTRGAFGETLAAALLPWFLWSLLRLVERQTIGALVLCALVFACLMFSHNMIVYLSLPLFAALLVWELRYITASQRRNALVRAGGAILLGLGLTAIFWLPSLAELRFVWFSRDIQQGAALYLTDFLSLKNVIQFSVPYEYVVHPFPLSVAPMALGLLGLAAVLVLGRDRKLVGRILIFAAMGLIYTVLLLDLTVPIWQGVPLLNGMQFPWRLSTFIGLGMALMIGSLASFVVPRRFTLVPAGSGRVSGIVATVRVVSVIALVGILMWNGLDRLFVQRTYGPVGGLGLGQIARNEMNMGRLGLSSQREYLPVTVQALFSHVDLSPAAKEPPTVELEKYGSTQRAFTITAQEPISISLRTFYFPGWQASVDGKSVTAYPSTPMGLVTADVPSGTHRIGFTFQDTLVRQLGAVLSGIGVLVLLALVVRVFYQREIEWLGISSFLVIGIALMALPLTVALRAPPNAWQPMRLDISPELRMIGWRVQEAQFDTSAWQLKGSRRSLDLDVVWQVKQPLQDKPFAWRLVDDTGRVWIESEQMARYGSGTPATWLRNEIVQDHYSIPLDLSAPSGLYGLRVAYGGGDYVPIGRVALERLSPPMPSEPAIARRMVAQVGEDVRLLGFDAVDRAYPGQTLPITLYWQAERPVFEDYTVFVQVLTLDGDRVSQWDSLTDGINPTTLWAPGVTVPDRRDILLPRNLEPGLYRLVAGMYRHPDNPERLPVITSDGPSADDVLELGMFKVPMNAPNAQPAHPLNASLGPAIRLVGYDLQTSPNEARLKLYWEASQPVKEDYKVFVHLIDDAEKIVAQQDRMPSDGRYPTRIWEARERIIDAYTFSLVNIRSGQYRIHVGMYSPNTGERLITLDSGGRELLNRQIPVTSFEVHAP